MVMKKKKSLGWWDFPNTQKIEDPLQWTEEKIRERSARISSDKGPEGDFDD